MQRIVNGVFGLAAAGFAVLNGSIAWTAADRGCVAIWLLYTALSCFCSYAAARSLCPAVFGGRQD